MGGTKAARLAEQKWSKNLSNVLNSRRLGPPQSSGLVRYVGKSTEPQKIMLDYLIAAKIRDRAEHFASLIYVSTRKTLI